MRSERLAVLDGMRGIAAVCVVLHHAGQLHPALAVLPRAYLAVDFFFLLSGFVLTLAYEEELRHGLAPLRFVAMRVGRLWPMAAVGILIGGIAGFAWSPAESELIVLALTLFFVPALVGPRAIYPLNGPMWSLAFELIANMVHAVLLVRLRDSAVALITLACALALAACALHADSIGLGDTGANWPAGFARVGFSYGLGVWLARKHSLAGMRPGLPAWVALAALPIVLLGTPLAPLPHGAGDLIVAMVVFPLLLWFATGESRPWFGTARVAKLGSLSYPAYALHIPLFNLYRAALPRVAGTHGIAGGLAVVASVLFLSWLAGKTALARGMMVRGGRRMTR